MAMAGIVLLALGIFALWLSPLRLETLQKRLIESMEQFTGAKAEYRSAELHVALGLYEIKGLRLADAKNTSITLLAADSIRIHLNAWDMVFGKGLGVHEVEISGPSSMEILYDRYGPHLGLTPAFLRQAILRARAATQKRTGVPAGRLPFDTLRIKDARISLAEMKPLILPLGEIEESRPVIAFTGDLEVRNSGRGEITAQFSGNGLAPEMDGTGGPGRPVATGIEAAISLTRRNKADEYKMEAAIANVSLPTLFQNLPGTSASGAGLHVTVEGERNAKGVSAKVNLECQELDLRSVEPVSYTHLTLPTIYSV